MKLIKNYDELVRSTDRKLLLQRKIALETVEGVISSIQPMELLKRHVVHTPPFLQVASLRKPLEAFRFRVVGFGKAAAAMAYAIERLLPKCPITGVVIAPDGVTNPGLNHIQLLTGTHPVVSEQNLLNSKELLRCLREGTSSETLLILISGGGSALFELPLCDVPLSALKELTNQLLAAGLPIEEINLIRRHLSQVKGGKLVNFIQSEETVVFVIADVLGHSSSEIVSLVASGPTVADNTSVNDAIAVLELRNLWENVPVEIQAVLKNQSRSELSLSKPKMEVEHIIIGDNLRACQTAATIIQRYNFSSIILTTHLTGEASIAAKFIASVVKSVISSGEPIRLPAALIFGGETTVEVKGTGKGGRNQELAVALALELGSFTGWTLFTLGTDGIDGNSPAAGALIDSQILENADEKLSKPLEAYLKNNDTFSALSALNAAIITGWTNTNVMDVVVVFVAANQQNETNGSQ